MTDDKVKQKLLDILEDNCLPDLEVGTLLKIVADIIDKQKAEIKRLEVASQGELARLMQDRENLHREISEIRRNPSLVIWNQKFFLGEKDRRYLAVNGPHFRLSERIGNVDYLMREISCDEYEARQ